MLTRKLGQKFSHCLKKIRKELTRKKDRQTDRKKLNILFDLLDF